MSSEQPLRVSLGLVLDDAQNAAALLDDWKESGTSPFNAQALLRTHGGVAPGDDGTDNNNKGKPQDWLTCSFVKTGANKHSGYSRLCHTCTIAHGKQFDVCLICSETCHIGHNLSVVRQASRFYCSCGARGKGACQSLGNKDDERAHKAHGGKSGGVQSDIAGRKYTTEPLLARLAALSSLNTPRDRVEAVEELRTAMKLSLSSTTVERPHRLHFHMSVAFLRCYRRLVAASSGVVSPSPGQEDKEEEEEEEEKDVGKGVGERERSFFVEEAFLSILASVDNEDAVRATLSALLERADHGPLALVCRPTEQRLLEALLDRLDDCSTRVRLFTNMGTLHDCLNAVELLFEADAPSTPHIPSLHLWGRRWDALLAGNVNREHSTHFSELLVACDHDHQASSPRFLPNLNPNPTLSRFVAAGTGLDVSDQAPRDSSRGPCTWEFNDGSSWKPFDAQTARMLDRVYVSGGTRADYQVSGTTYHANLSTMRQRNDETGREREIRVTTDLDVHVFAFHLLDDDNNDDVAGLPVIAPKWCTIPAGDLGVYRCAASLNVRAIHTHHTVAEWHSDILRRLALPSKLTAEVYLSKGERVDVTSKSTLASAGIPHKGHVFIKLVPRTVRNDECAPHPRPSLVTTAASPDGRFLFVLDGTTGLARLGTGAHGTTAGKVYVRRGAMGVHAGAQLACSDTELLIRSPLLGPDVLLVVDPVTLLPLPRRLVVSDGQPRPSTWRLSFKDPYRGLGMGGAAQEGSEKGSKEERDWMPLPEAFTCVIRDALATAGDAPTTLRIPLREGTLDAVIDDDGMALEQVIDGRVRCFAIRSDPHDDGGVAPFAVDSDAGVILLLDHDAPRIISLHQRSEVTCSHVACESLPDESAAFDRLCPGDRKTATVPQTSPSPAPDTSTTTTTNDNNDSNDNDGDGDEGYGMGYDPQEYVSGELFAMLLSMGFGADRCMRALVATHSANVDSALAWLTDHEGDPTLDEPWVPPGRDANPAARPSSANNDDEGEEEEEKDDELCAMLRDIARHERLCGHGAADSASDAPPPPTTTTTTTTTGAVVTYLRCALIKHCPSLLTTPNNDDDEEGDDGKDGRHPSPVCGACGVCFHTSAGQEFPRMFVCESRECGLDTVHICAVCARMNPLQAVPTAPAHNASHHLAPVEGSEPTPPRIRTRDVRGVALSYSASTVVVTTAAAFTAIDLSMGAVRSVTNVRDGASAYAFSGARSNVLWGLCAENGNMKRFKDFLRAAPTTATSTHIKTATDAAAAILARLRCVSYPRTVSGMSRSEAGAGGGEGGPLERLLDSCVRVLARLPASALPDAAALLDSLLTYAEQSHVVCVPASCLARVKSAILAAAAKPSAHTGAIVRVLAAHAELFFPTPSDRLLLVLQLLQDKNASLLPGLQSSQRVLMQSALVDVLEGSFGGVCDAPGLFLTPSMRTSPVDAGTMARTAAAVCAYVSRNEKKDDDALACLSLMSLLHQLSLRLADAAPEEAETVVVLGCGVCVNVLKRCGAEGAAVPARLLTSSLMWLADAPLALAPRETVSELVSALVALSCSLSRRCAPRSGALTDLPLRQHLARVREGSVLVSEGAAPPSTRKPAAAVAVSTPAQLPHKLSERWAVRMEARSGVRMLPSALSLFVRLFARFAVFDNRDGDGGGRQALTPYLTRLRFEQILHALSPFVFPTRDAPLRFTVAAAANKSKSKAKKSNNNDGDDDGVVRPLAQHRADAAAAVEALFEEYAHGPLAAQVCGRGADQPRGVVEVRHAAVTWECEVVGTASVISKLDHHVHMEGFLLFWLDQCIDAPRTVLSQLRNLEVKQLASGAVLGVLDQGRADGERDALLLDTVENVRVAFDHVLAPLFSPVAVCGGLSAAAAMPSTTVVKLINSHELWRQSPDADRYTAFMRQLLLPSGSSTLLTQVHGSSPFLHQRLTEIKATSASNSAAALNLLVQRCLSELGGSRELRWLRNQPGAAGVCARLCGLEARFAGALIKHNMLIDDALALCCSMVPVALLDSAVSKGVRCLFHPSCPLWLQATVRAAFRSIRSLVIKMIGEWLDDDDDDDGNDDEKEAASGLVAAKKRLLLSVDTKPVQPLSPGPRIGIVIDTPMLSSSSSDDDDDGKDGGQEEKTSGNNNNNNSSNGDEPTSTTTTTKRSKKKGRLGSAGDVLSRIDDQLRDWSRNISFILRDLTTPPTALAPATNVNDHQQQQQQEEKRKTHNTIINTNDDDEADSEELSMRRVQSSRTGRVVGRLPPKHRSGPSLDPPTLESDDVDELELARTMTDPAERSSSDGSAGGGGSGGVRGRMNDVDWVVHLMQWPGPVAETLRPLIDAIQETSQLRGHLLRSLLTAMQGGNTDTVVDNLLPIVWRHLVQSRSADQGSTAALPTRGVTGVRLEDDSDALRSGRDTPPVAAVMGSSSAHILHDIQSVVRSADTTESLLSFYNHLAKTLNRHSASLSGGVVAWGGIQRVMCFFSLDFHPQDGDMVLGSGLLTSLSRLIRALDSYLGTDDGSVELAQRMRGLAWHTLLYLVLFCLSNDGDDATATASARRRRFVMASSVGQQLFALLRVNIEKLERVHDDDGTIAPGGRVLKADRARSLHNELVYQTVDVLTLLRELSRQAQLSVCTPANVAALVSLLSRDWVPTVVAVGVAQLVRDELPHHPPSAFAQSFPALLVETVGHLSSHAQLMADGHTAMASDPMEQQSTGYDVPPPHDDRNEAVPGVGGDALECWGVQSWEQTWEGRVLLFEEALELLHCAFVLPRWTFALTKQVHTTLFSPDDDADGVSVALLGALAMLGAHVPVPRVGASVLVHCVTPHPQPPSGRWDVDALDVPAPVFGPDASVFAPDRPNNVLHAVVTWHHMHVDFVTVAVRTGIRDGLSQLVQREVSVEQVQVLRSEAATVSFQQASERLFGEQTRDKSFSRLLSIAKKALTDGTDARQLLARRVGRMAVQVMAQFARDCVAWLPRHAVELLAALATPQGGMPLSAQCARLDDEAVFEHLYHLVSLPRTRPSELPVEPLADIPDDNGEKKAGDGDDEEEEVPLPVFRRRGVRAGSRFDGVAVPAREREEQVMFLQAQKVEQEAAEKEKASQRKKEKRRGGRSQGTPAIIQTLTTVMEMGFPEPIAKAALARASGNAQRAAEWILTGQVFSESGGDVDEAQAQEAWEAMLVNNGLKEEVDEYYERVRGGEQKSDAASADADDDNKPVKSADDGDDDDKGDALVRLRELMRANAAKVHSCDRFRLFSGEYLKRRLDARSTVLLTEVVISEEASAQWNKHMQHQTQRKEDQVAYRKGDKLKVLDTVNKVCPAEVQDIRDASNEILIHYTGWSERWNEWLPITSDRIIKDEKEDGKDDSQGDDAASTDPLPSAESCQVSFSGMTGVIWKLDSKADYALVRVLDDAQGFTCFVWMKLAVLRLFTRSGSGRGSSLSPAALQAMTYREVMVAAGRTERQLVREVSSALVGFAVRRLGSAMPPLSFPQLLPSLPTVCDCSALLEGLPVVRCVPTLAAPSTRRELIAALASRPDVLEQLDQSREACCEAMARLVQGQTLIATATEVPRRPLTQHNRKERYDQEKEREKLLVGGSVASNSSDDRQRKQKKKDDDGDDVLGVCPAVFRLEPFTSHRISVDREDVTSLLVGFRRDSETTWAIRFFADPVHTVLIREVPRICYDEPECPVMAPFVVPNPCYVLCSPVYMYSKGSDKKKTREVAFLNAVPAAVPALEHSYMAAEVAVATGNDEAMRAWLPVFQAYLEDAPPFAPLRARAILSIAQLLTRLSAPVSVDWLAGVVVDEAARRYAEESSEAPLFSVHMCFLVELLVVAVAREGSSRLRAAIRERIPVVLAVERKMLKTGQEEKEEDAGDEKSSMSSLVPHLINWRTSFDTVGERRWSLLLPGEMPLDPFPFAAAGWTAAERMSVFDRLLNATVGRSGDDSIPDVEFHRFKHKQRSARRQARPDNHHQQQQQQEQEEQAGRRSRLLLLNPAEEERRSRDRQERERQHAFKASMFGQLCSALKKIPTQKLRSEVGAITWRTTLSGAVDEGGRGLPGPFRQALHEICREITESAFAKKEKKQEHQDHQNDDEEDDDEEEDGNEEGETTSLYGLFIPSPNRSNETGENRSVLIVDPSRSQARDLQRLFVFGQLLGVAIRSKCSLDLELAPTFWKQLIGCRPMTADDLKTVDHTAWQLLRRDGPLAARDAFETLEPTFSTRLSDGRTVVPLRVRGTERRVAFAERDEWAAEALEARHRESLLQMQSIQLGLYSIIPKNALVLLTWHELQRRVCGEPVIDLDVLRRHTTYQPRTYSPSSAYVQQFWEVLEAFSNQDRARFLQFVWARTRLPSDMVDGGNNNYRMQVSILEGAQHQLPSSETCFFNLKLPKYESKEKLREKLLLAICNCTTITF